MSTVYSPGQQPSPAFTAEIESDILKQLPMFVFIVSKEFTIQYINTSFERQFGSPKKNYNFCYDLIQGRTEPCPDCPMQKVLDSQQEEVWEWKDHLRGNIYEHHYFPYLTHADESMALAIGTDITYKNRSALYPKSTKWENLVRICSYCKSIAAKNNTWQSIEEYFGRKNQMTFSHGICPHCIEKHHPEMKHDQNGDPA